MKKVYAKLAERKLNFFRPFYKASFVKMLSLSSIVALLSSASPVYSKTVAPKEAFLISAKSSSIVFPQSVISVYDDYNVEASDQENYVTALQGENTLAASAVSDYVNFLTTTFFRKSHDNAIINILTVYNSFARVIGYGSDLGLWGTSSLLEENYPTKFKVETFGDISTRDTGDPDPDRSYQAGDQASAGGKNAIAIGYTAKARDKDNIAIGARAEAKGYSSVAIGSEYTVQDPTEHTSAIDDYTTAVGAIAMSTKFGASSFGHRSYATNKEALSLGFKSVANVETSVALGAESVANISAGVAGYAPLLQGKSTDSEIAWKSTMGAVSVGYVAWKKTRQITAVAAGFEDTDAVNVAQLKSLQGYVNKGWKLSVDDKNATVVSIDDTVDFSAGSNNFTITKGEDDNNVKFDLAKSITVDKIETGNNTLDATGLIITGGPKITTAGIDAGSKKITGVEKGTDANDAVNFSQLKEIKEQVASSGLVAQDAQTKDITIGKEADGDKIDILNNKGKNRVLSGITNGIISDASTEAITGQQLYQLGTSIAGSLGGGASFSGGTWTAPKFKVKTVKADGEEGEETVYDDVASALAGVGNSFKDIKNEITNVVTKVEGDSLSWSKEANAFVAKHGAEDAKTSSKIMFLANGDVSKGSTDAINGSQLYSLGDTFATYLGGGAKYENGEWTAPKFKVKTVKADGKEGEETVYNDVASALAGVGNSFTNIKNEITNVVTKVEGDSLSWSKEYGAFVARHEHKQSTEETGKAVRIQENSKIMFLANGVVSKDSTDAINGSQLYSLGDTFAKYFGGGASFSGGTWTAPEFKIKTVNADGAGSEETVYNDVASALAGVGNSFTNIKNEITNVVSKVEGDSLSWSKEANAFVARHEHEQSTEETGKAVRAQENSKITFLAKGDVSSTSTDAVNGTQLFETNDKVATYLGGGSKYEEGKWTAPIFKVKTVKDDGSDVEDKEYKTVAEALAGVGTSITNVKKEISNEITNVVSDNLVKQDEASKIIKIGAEKDGTEITIVSNEGANRTLSGIKEAIKNNEAVNKGQLDESLKKLSTSLQSDESAVVHYDKKEGDETDYTNVTFGKGKDSTPVGLHNVADGKIAENSHDVVTGGQINKIGGDIAKFLGGEVSFKDGALTQPTYKLSQIAKDGVVTENSFNDVGAAFGGLDTNIKNVNQRIKEVSENVAQDSLSWSKEDDAFVAKHGAEKIASKIKFVAGGDLSENSTDAVNGGQLFETNERVSAVESQVSSIDKQVKDIESTVTNGVVKYDQDGEGHKVNKVTLVGVNESDPVLIDNVGDGKIESGSKEAVNGGQLHDYTEQQMKIVLDDAKKYTDDKVDSAINNAADEAKSYTDMKFGTLSYAVQDIRKEARQAAAIGLAVANLSYDDTPGKLSVTFGSGVWRNQSAFALGAGYMSENGRVRSNLSVTSAGGHWGVGAGFRVTLN
ncbi:YadA-like family protein [Bartonella taylorii]|uniref:YadA-like family protein n=1 Tax=Bartonella taylorii TaxID=33046 RepID=UPI00208F4F22|nr:YadA-like family protein [Bartonella taylorii]USP00947.1 YadA-like family protein [Bartonella taylorii]